MKNERRTTLSLILLDVLALVLAFNAMGMLWGTRRSELVITPLGIPAGLLLIAVYLIDGYRERTDMLSLEYASQHAIALFSALLATLLVTFAVIPGGYALQQSRAVVALSFLTLFIVTLAYRRFIYARTSRRRKGRTLVFIGDQSSAQGFLEECMLAGMQQPILHANGSNATAVGPSRPEHATVAFQEVLARLRDRTLQVEAIVLRESSGELSADMSQQLVDLYFEGVPTYTLELFHQIYWRKIPMYRLNQTWLFQEGFEIAREPVFERIKRIADIMLAGTGLILAAPVVGFAGLAVWLEDRGPVLFRQMRIGKNREPFTVYKLRTMRSNHDGPLYVADNDERVTKVGRLLRTTRIDEIPQLLNVVKGEMSLIGPRAEWDRLVADYERQIPCYHFRHLVRPGITGWAQVNYPYGASIDDTLRKLEYDLYYIRHFSFRLDASIVLKTVHVMLFGKGR